MSPEPRTDPSPDSLALRTGRRERAFAAMESHDLDVLVLGRVANIRYVSGVPLLWNAGTRPFGPGCVAVRATGDIHLLSTWDEAVPEEIPHEHLYGITWNPMNLASVVQAIVGGLGACRVGTDATSPLFARLLPSVIPDAEIVDAGPALHDARRIKTAEEVDAIRVAVGVADSALADAFAELRTGATEHGLAAVFMDAMASQGITTPLTQNVVSITSPLSGDGIGGSPGARSVLPGDLVAFTGGIVADGYSGEVGRTWPVEADTSAVADLYGRWGHLWQCLLDACRPGAPASALLDAYRDAGEPLPVLPIGRGLGLGFDDPVVVGALPDTAARERLDPGVVLVITASVTDDDIGTVTTHEPVLITVDGPELLSRSPFWQPEEAGTTP